MASLGHAQGNVPIEHGDLGVAIRWAWKWECMLWSPAHRGCMCLWRPRELVPLSCLGVRHRVHLRQGKIAWPHGPRTAISRHHFDDVGGILHCGSRAVGRCRRGILVARANRPDNVNDARSFACSHSETLSFFSGLAGRTGASLSGAGVGACRCEAGRSRSAVRDASSASFFSPSCSSVRASCRYSPTRRPGEVFRPASESRNDA